MLNSEHRYFLVVAETGSLSGASKQLFVAISAISRQIQRLETQMDVQLFERHARGMVLTEAGEMLKQYLRKSLLDMDHVLTKIKGLKAIRQTHLRIACPNGIAFVLLPQLLAEFCANHCAVHFSLKVANALTITEMVQNGDCDLALQFSLSPEHNVEVINSWPAPVQLVMKHSHPLAMVDKINLADLNNYPTALPEKNSTVRQLFDLSCRINGFMLEPIMTCDNFSALFYFLIHTHQAITISSPFTLALKRQKHGLILRSISIDQLNQRTLQLQTSMSRRHNPELDLLLDYLSDRLSELQQTFTLPQKIKRGKVVNGL